MVANVGKLRGKIAENGYNNGTFAKAMGISDVTLRRKINDAEHEFGLGEINKARQLLKLTDNELLAIFFG